MSGVSIVHTLLRAHVPLTQLVPPSQIYVGSVPLGKVKVVVTVRSIGSYEFQTTTNGLSTKLIRERVQVTVYSNDDPVLMERVLKVAALGRGVYTGTVAGYPVRSVLRDNVGPYIGPGDNDKIHEQSRDFMVTFIEAN